jgi:hypothetical protein
MPRSKVRARRSKKPEPKGPKFALFPKLPTEIRAIIWKMTLQPRVVELARYPDAGFRALVSHPPALEVSRDSRAATIQLYPLCFGTYWYAPTTRFNYALDTIYLDYGILHELAFFVAILSQSELSQIRYLALDMSLFVDERYISVGDNGTYQETLSGGLERVVNVLPALEQLTEVHDMRVWAEHCFWFPEKDDLNSNGGQIDFSKELPLRLQNRELQINPNLPAPSEHFKTWGIKSHKVVFGMRKGWTVGPGEPENPNWRTGLHRYSGFFNGVYGGRFVDLT